MPQSEEDVNQTSNIIKHQIVQNKFNKQAKKRLPFFSLWLENEFRQELHDEFHDIRQCSILAIAINFDAFAPPTIDRAVPGRPKADLSGASMKNNVCGIQHGSEEHTTVSNFSVNK